MNVTLTRPAQGDGNGGGGEGVSVGFVRLELINYVAALINARNGRLDEALLSSGVLETVIDLFFSTQVRLAVERGVPHSYCRDSARRCCTRT